MRKNIFRLCITATVLAAIAQSTSAHHAFASEFDSKRPVRLTGVVKRMELSNPHSWLHLQVTTDAGIVQDWAIEGAAPNALIRRGWNKNSLPPGILVTVRGFHARDRSFRAAGVDVTLQDGSKLFVGADTGASAAPQRDAAPK